jgi:hypothetical protein
MQSGLDALRETRTRRALTAEEEEMRREDLAALEKTEAKKPSRTTHPRLRFPGIRGEQRKVPPFGRR